MGFFNLFRKKVVALVDPATLTTEQAIGEAIEARKRAGLLPWPSRDRSHYFNTVVGTCSVCEQPIYGGEAILIDYGNSDDTRCGKHFPP